jgi:hypothetical protein
MTLPDHLRTWLLASAASLFLLGALPSPATATPSSFTDASFITVDADTQLQFTFVGFSAADTDQLRLGDLVIFENQTAVVGQTVTTGPLAAGTYQLSLTNLTSGLVFSSAPLLNPDGAHLGVSNQLADFNLATLPPSLSIGLLYGWEDRPLANAGTLDYNDLVFSLAVVPRAMPEPGTLLLLGSGLLALGLLHRGRGA